ncbi:MAG: nucleoside hydrolase, partial [Acidobacteriota bacterium]|nr:nucleoside hydrolase [Acidobacteriota bacterium]
MSGQGPPRVWVDTDIALGAPAGDVDDGFALAALLAASRAGRVELLGISTVSGNASAAEAEDCARAMAAASGVESPVLRGESAEAAIAGLPEGARIVAIGPLSNVAAALSAAPDLASRATLRLVGGNLSSRGILPPLWPHEFNLAHDRRAARAVLSAPWRELVLYPLDVV